MGRTVRRFLESRWSYWPAFGLTVTLAFTLTLAGSTGMTRLEYEQSSGWQTLGTVTRIATYATAVLGLGHGWCRDRFLGSVLCVAGAFGAARIPFWLAYGV